MTSAVPQYGAAFLDTGLKFSLPFNHDPAWVDCIVNAYAPFVESVYAPLPPRVHPTLYNWRGGDPGHYEDIFLALTERLAGKGIMTNMVLNADTPDPLNFEPLFAFLEKHLDTRWMSATVNNVILARELRRRYGDLKLYSSVTSDISSINEASFWRWEAGVDGITAAQILTKKTAMLQRIRSLGLSVRLVVNNGCLPACPFRHQHWTLVYGASFDRAMADRRLHEVRENCTAVRRNAMYILWQSQVVPADLPRYKNIIDVVKIEGRSRTTDNLVQIVDAYLAMESRRHPDYDYFEPPETLDRLADCDRTCQTCGWCEKTFARHNPRLYAPLTAATGGNGTGTLTAPVPGLLTAITAKLQPVLGPYLSGDKPLARHWWYEDSEVFAERALLTTFVNRDNGHRFRMLAEPLENAREQPWWATVQGLGICEWRDEQDEHHDQPSRGEIRHLRAFIAALRERQRRAAATGGDA